MNLEADAKLGVPVLLVVEDSVRFYSSFLPAIYAEVMKLSQSVFSRRGEPLPAHSPHEGASQDHPHHQLRGGLGLLQPVPIQRHGGDVRRSVSPVSGTGEGLPLGGLGARPSDPGSPARRPHPPSVQQPTLPGDGRIPGHGVPAEGLPGHAGGHPELPHPALLLRRLRVPDCRRMGRRWTVPAIYGPSWRSWRRFRPRASASTLSAMTSRAGCGPGASLLWRTGSGRGRSRTTLRWRRSGMTDPIHRRLPAESRVGARWPISTRRSCPTRAGSCGSAEGPSEGREGDWPSPRAWWISSVWRVVSPMSGSSFPLP